MQSVKEFKKQTTTTELLKAHKIHTSIPMILSKEEKKKTKICIYIYMFTKEKKEEKKINMIYNTVDKKKIQIYKRSCLPIWHHYKHVQVKFTENWEKNMREKKTKDDIGMHSILGHEITWIFFVGWIVGLLTDF